LSSLLLLGIVDARDVLGPGWFLVTEQDSMMLYFKYLQVVFGLLLVLFLKQIVFKRNLHRQWSVEKRTGKTTIYI